MTITRSQVTFGARVGVFTAIVSALSSLVTLQTKISGIAGDVAKEARIELKRDFAPVGTIVASYLNPAQFAKITGETLGDDIHNRTWILADGIEVRGTEFAKATDNKHIPDLRGMFIRGLNPDEPRVAGSFEDDATAFPKTPFVGQALSSGVHYHDGGAGSIPSEKYNVGGTNYSVVIPGRTADSGAHIHDVTINGGDKETRPKNVGVYYYIKIK